MRREGGSVSKLDFGQVYFGDQRSEAVYLVNMGCMPARFCAACGTLSGSRDAEGSRNAAPPQQLLHASLVQVPVGGTLSLGRQRPKTPYLFPYFRAGSGR